MIRAECVQPCQWRGQYWPEWGIYEGEETPPSRFFKELETPSPGTDGTGGCECDCGGDANYARLKSLEITEDS